MNNNENIYSKNVMYKSENACQAFLEYCERLSLGTTKLYQNHINAAPMKSEVLNSLKNHLDSHRSLDSVNIHYNGHGKVVVDNKLAHTAGRWVCGNNEEISIEDILKICSNKAENQPAHDLEPQYNQLGGANGMIVSICNDCSGASGFFASLL
jgi:hypothetical protein